MTENFFQMPVTKDQLIPDPQRATRPHRPLVTHTGCASLVGPAMVFVLVLQNPGFKRVQHAMRNTVALTFSCSLIINVWVFRDRITVTRRHSAGCQPVCVDSSPTTN